MKPKFLFPSLFIIGLSACQSPRYVYAPSPPNNAYFKEKGDSKIAAYYGVGASNGSYGGAKNFGFDIQGAYAITNHLAVTVDHFYRKEKDVYNFYESAIFDSSSVNYQRHITSLGMGYFFKMNRRNKVTFSIYAGAGIGKFNINDKGVFDTRLAYARFHKSNVTKWYIQPGFNFMPGKVFWCSVNTRFAFVNYSKIATSYTEEEIEIFELKNLSGHTLALFEPSYTMQIGVPHCPWLKMNAGITFCASISAENNGYDYGTYYEARVLTGSFGLTLDPSQIVKRKKHRP